MIILSIGKTNLKKRLSKNKNGNSKKGAIKNSKNNGSE